MGKVLEFPIPYPIEPNGLDHVWTEEEIIRAYAENFEYEKDEYYYNWLMRQEQEEAKKLTKKLACFAHKLITKIISIFQ